MKSYQPKVVTLWLGNNDVLGYATSGGLSPSSPTDIGVFQTKFKQIADSISNLTSQPKVIVATIPDVSITPFFTFINKTLVGRIPSGRIYFTNSNNILDSILVDSTTYLSGSLYKRGMITLLGGSKIGNGSTTFTGLVKEIPLSNQDVLDANEAAVSKTAVEQYNSVIKTIASEKGWAVADVNAEFNSIASTGSAGKYFQGKKVTIEFISGGLFSYDGIHPSSLGQALIADFFIKSMNSKYGASIKEVDLNTVPGLKFGKISQQNFSSEFQNEYVSALESMIGMLGGSVR